MKGHKPTPPPQKPSEAHSLKNSEEMDEIDTFILIILKHPGSPCCDVSETHFHCIVLHNNIRHVTGKS